MARNNAYENVLNSIYGMRVEEKEEMKYKIEDIEYVADVLVSKYNYGTTGHLTWPINIEDKIKKVIFSGPMTIILWDDGTKTTVRCAEGTKFDPYVGFCAAVTKKLFGTNSHLHKFVQAAVDESLPNEEK